MTRENWSMINSHYNHHVLKNLCLESEQDGDTWSWKSIFSDEEGSDMSPLATTFLERLQKEKVAPSSSHPEKLIKLDFYGIQEGKRVYEVFYVEGDHQVTRVEGTGGYSKKGYTR